MKETAIVSRLPFRDGDGYSFGGDVILTIGKHSVQFGIGQDALNLANRVAEAWNVYEQNEEPRQ